MRPQLIVVLALGAVLFAFGSFASYFFSLGVAPFDLGMGAIVNLVLLTLVVLISSLFLFGYIGVLAILLIGLMFGEMMLVNPIAVYLSALPMLVALVAGNLAGIHLRMDLEGQGNIRDHRYKILLLAGAAVLIAVIIGAVIQLGLVPQIDFAGIMNAPQQAPAPSSGMPYADILKQQ